jgi:hypothetical protein
VREVASPDDGGVGVGGGGGELGGQGRSLRIDVRVE